MVPALYQLIFYIFAAALVVSAVLVIVTRNPVRALLFLVLCFFFSAILWMLLQAEFVALVLIFVYVGAVMTLFLFVVMMLNIDLVPLREGFVRYLPIGILVLLLLLAIMFFVLTGQKSMSNGLMPTARPVTYSNVSEVGNILFTQYLGAFEIAGLILLVAMIAAISLAFHGRKPGTKAQRVQDQLNASKATGLRIVKMKTEI